MDSTWLICPILGDPWAHTCGCSPPIVVVTASTMSVVFVRTLAILNLHLSSHVATASMICLLLACLPFADASAWIPADFWGTRWGSSSQEAGATPRTLGSCSSSTRQRLLLRRPLLLLPSPYCHSYTVSLTPPSCRRSRWIQSERERGACMERREGAGRRGIHLFWRSSRRHSSSISCVAVPGRQPITARPRRAPLFALRADMNEKRQTLSVSAPSSSSSETGGCNF